MKVMKVCREVTVRIGGGCYGCRKGRMSGRINWVPLMITGDWEGLRRKRMARRVDEISRRGGAGRREAEGRPGRRRKRISMMRMRMMRTRTRKQKEKNKENKEEEEETRKALKEWTEVGSER